MNEFELTVSNLYFSPIPARPGMRKTATVASIAVKFAQEAEEMKDIDFLWTISLKNVDQTSSLEELVVKEHGKLDTESIPVIKHLLSGRTEHTAALLFDGYDEYKCGTNTAVDRAVEFGVGRCVLSLESGDAS